MSKVSVNIEENEGEMKVNFTMSVDAASLQEAWDEIYLKVAELANYSDEEEPIEEEEEEREEEEEEQETDPRDEAPFGSEKEEDSEEGQQPKKRGRKPKNDVDSLFSDESIKEFKEQREKKEIEEAPEDEGDVFDRIELKAISERTGIAMATIYSDIKAGHLIAQLMPGSKIKKYITSEQLKDYQRFRAEKKTRIKVERPASLEIGRAHTEEMPPSPSLVEEILEEEIKLAHSEPEENPPVGPLVEEKVVLPFKSVDTMSLTKVMDYTGMAMQEIYNGVCANRFPLPVREFAKQPIWDADDVKKWFRAYTKGEIASAKFPAAGDVWEAWAL